MPLSVLQIYQNTCVSLSNSHADLVAVCTQLASCDLHTDMFDFVCSDDIKLGCKDPMTFSFFCKLKGLPSYIWRVFLLPSLLHSVTFHSSISPVFPPERRWNFDSKKRDSIVLCIIWKTPCEMSCEILIFTVSNVDNTVDRSRKGWLADLWR